VSERVRVLVVEDDPDIRMTIMEVLEDRGFEVRGAGHGQEALDLLGAEATLPHVILLDLLMPVLDGAGFRAAQLNDARFAAIPVVIVSANAQVREAASRLGVKGYLAKPVAFADLLHAVSTHAAPL
jgi:two-component system, chemotaxis family, chemotaxis protein CheY